MARCQSQQSVNTWRAWSAIESQNHALKVACAQPLTDDGGLNAVYVADAFVAEEDLDGVCVVLITWFWDETKRLPDLRNDCLCNVSKACNFKRHFTNGKVRI